MGVEAMSTLRFSPLMPSGSFFSFCLALRWGSRSVMQNTGSPGSSPMRMSTVVPSARTTVPCSASGMATHWYLRMPP